MAKPRKTKRVRAGAPAGTRARILEEATRLFAEHGYNGCSVGDICGAARVNRRMLYHYFGDKAGLYRAIFLAQWTELRAWSERGMQAFSGAGSGDAGGLLVSILGVVFDFMASHPRFVRLTMWEGLEGGQVSRSIWTEARGPLFVQAEFLVREAQRQGRLDQGLDPAHLIISFLGAVSYYFGFAPSLSDMLGGQDPLSRAALAKRKAELIKLLGVT